jgi:hypothetical protein
MNEQWQSNKSMSKVAKTHIKHARSVLGHHVYTMYDSTNGYIGQVERQSEYGRSPCQIAYLYVDCDEGSNAVMHMLMNRDLRGWNQRTLPHTDEKNRMMQMSLDPVSAFLCAFAEELSGETYMPGDDADHYYLDEKCTVVEIAKEAMRKRYHSYCITNGVKAFSDKKFGGLLYNTGLIKEKQNTRKNSEGKRLKGYEIIIPVVLTKFGILQATPQEA